ncbi:MAG: hypothetical protein IT337_02640 [Thermomicrobiales bacterium]|nr:hypothetical protein [Thermomicrobiales bacterium]
MEDARFDRLARKIGVLTTGRTTLAAAVGAALGVLGWAESEAAKSGACKQQCPECQR